MKVSELRQALERSPRSNYLSTREPSIVRIVREVPPSFNDDARYFFGRVAPAIDSVLDVYRAIAEELLVELERIRGCEDHEDCIRDRRLAVACHMDREKAEARTAAQQVAMRPLNLNEAQRQHLRELLGPNPGKEP